MSVGRLVCVMGVDGSGKSTAVTRVVDDLVAQGVDAGYLWNRWEPRLLAPFMGRRSYGGVGSDSNEAMAAGASAPRSADGYSAKRRLLGRPLMAPMWLAAASFDYALSGVPLTRAAQAQHAITMCDRYTPDFVVDQAMNLGGGPAALSRAAGAPFLRRFPVPDVHVLFDLPADAAYGRKADVPSLEVLEAKRQLYLAFAQRVSAVVIDANRDAAAVAESLRHAVEQALRERDA